jgi:hypothetical protein
MSRVRIALPVSIQIALIRRTLMKRLRAIKVVTALCAALATSSAWADGSPFVGRWHSAIYHAARRARTERSHGRICQGGQQHLTWSVTIITPQGRRYVETIDVAPDGKFYPISSDTTGAFRLTATPFRRHSRARPVSPTRSGAPSRRTKGDDLQRRTERGKRSDRQLPGRLRPDLDPICNGHGGCNESRHSDEVCCTAPDRHDACLVAPTSITPRSTLLWQLGLL